MITSLLILISSSVIAVIAKLGYAGVFFLMALESAAIPIPSEIIMPFSGFLVFEGKFNFWASVLTGTFGNVFGSLILYWIGAKWGRPFFSRFGKYFLIHETDLDLAERWFMKYGKAAVFFGRLLPVIRTYISFPAGLSKMAIKTFLVYTFIGAFFWSVFLTFLGVKFGENWKILEVYFRKFDLVIGAVILIFAVWWIWRHLKKKHLTSDN